MAYGTESTPEIFSTEPDLLLQLLPRSSPQDDTLPRVTGGRAAFWAEVRSCAKLGAPLAAGELGWMSTYIVDALMIGRMPHSALPIAASSLGNTIYYGIVFFAIYMLNGLETVIAQAVGGGDKAESVRTLMQSMWIVAAGTPLVMVATLAGAKLLPACGVSPELTQNTTVYLHVLVLSTLPLMLYMALRRFLQSFNRVASIAISLLTAGAVNWLFDWLLIFGHWHLPALGLAGSGWATCVVRCWMVMLLLPAAMRAFRDIDVWPRLRMLRPDPARLKVLLRIGWPSGMEFSLELAISTFMSVLCARLGTTLLAAHQVTLDLNAFVYMVPTGLSYAAMIHVGQAAGRNDLAWVKRATNATLLLGLGYGTLAAGAFLGFASTFAGMYTNDPHVVAAAIPLFWLCSLLILGDAAFVIHASALTGLGDTRTPLWVSLICNWGVGMPLAYLLAFPLGHGLMGLWTGRAVASLSSGLLLSLLWQRRMRAEERSHAPLNLPLLASMHAA